MDNKNKNKDSKQTNVQNRKKKKIKPWKVVLLVFVLVILIAAGAGTGIVLAFVHTAPEPNVDDLKNRLALTTTIYDKDGNYVESLHGVENRTYVQLSQIKKYTQDAFIAIEDERFREHFGIDIKRIFGALLADIKSRSAEQGASTITQQLIKNAFLTKDKKISRKIQEAYMAIELEKKLSKDQILEYYLNTIHLGGSASGIQAAAEYYFSKNVDQLTIGESALIAGITQSPSKYNPYFNTKTPEVYKDRTYLVLSKMLQHNMITKEEYDGAKKEVADMNENSFKKKDDNTKLKYQWFIEAATDSIADDLKTKYNYSTDQINQLLYSGGLKIYTTIDPKVQDVVDRVANDPKYFPTLKGDLAVYGTSKIIEPQVAVVINDYKTGQVRAILGGRGEQPLRSMNRATKIPRQPGSSMKPLAVYGPAFDLGYSPASIVDDSPFSPEESALAPSWPKEGPHNYDDNSYGGLTTIREAVKKSLNVVAAKLVLKIGAGTSTDYIKRFGISTLVDTGKNNDAGPSKVLGALTEGVLPIEMSAAYGVFGNGGKYVEPIVYTKVVDSEGNVLLEKKPETHQAISPQAAYLMTSVLKDAVIGGTGSWVTSSSKGNFKSTPSAGKTGTTENNENAYFAGYTSYYSGAIWMGHDKPSVGIKALSSSSVAWMWGTMMKEIHANLPSKDFDKPSGLVTASVCADSGKLPTDLCAKDPRGSRVISDLFIEGKVPTESCDVHVTALIDTSTGKLANEFCPPSLVREMVFLKKPYPSTDSRVKDKAYQVPTEVCNVHTAGTVVPTPTPTPNPTGTPGTTPTPSPSVTPTPTPTPTGKGKGNQ
jgi:penicillin-binding protein, 1A family